MAVCTSLKSWSVLGVPILLIENVVDLSPGQKGDIGRQTAPNRRVQLRRLVVQVSRYAALYAPTGINAVGHTGTSIGDRRVLCTHDTLQPGAGVDGRGDPSRQARHGAEIAGHNRVVHRAGEGGAGRQASGPALECTEIVIGHIERTRERHAADVRYGVGVGNYVTHLCVSQRDRRLFQQQAGLCGGMTGLTIKVALAVPRKLV